jgi:hypothetical protein
MLATGIEAVGGVGVEWGCSPGLLPRDALTLATPPPPDPRFYAATMTLLVSESRGGAGRLESVQTAPISRDGVALAVGTYDGACDFANALTRGGNRAIPPHGQLEWCLARLGTRDINGQYTLRITPRIRDELGNVVVPSASFQVVFER